MGARLGEVLKRHYEIISHHHIAVKIKKPEDIRFLKAFFGGSMWESNPPKLLFTTITGFEDQRVYQ